jgi:hypothetical protein
LPAAH